MFDLAHVLLLGSLSSSDFEWKGSNTLVSIVESGTIPEIKIVVYPNGALELIGGDGGPSDIEIGRWLTVLRPDFGNPVNLRVDINITSPSTSHSAEGPFGETVSISTDREYSVTSSAPVGTEVSGYITLQFAMVSSPDNILLEEIIDFVLLRTEEI